MNIFALDLDPITAASYHCDQHVNKMILESAQLLSTAAFYILPSHTYNIIKPHIYKPSYPKHPCSYWLRENPSVHKINYLKSLSLKLCDMWELEFNRSHHASKDVIQCSSEFLLEFIGQRNPFAYPLAPNSFTRAMPAVFKFHTGLDSVQAYRAYYRFKHTQWLTHKGIGMTYKNRPVPPFMEDLFTD